MSTLELRQAVKRYALDGDETVLAVDGVSLTVAPGELVALYGPSGSGKTTLLLIAAGLLSLDAGQVLFDGRDIATLSSREAALYRRRDVGVVFQSSHLVPGASALENAALKLLGDGATMSEASAAARPWLQRLGLQRRVDQPADRLSAGERQRVALARALVNEPRLLLADEPTGNLDSESSHATLALMRELCVERELPVLLVTHDPQGSRFADRVHTLRDGRLSDGLDIALDGALRR